MNPKLLGYFTALAGALLLTATNGFSYNTYGFDVNVACAPEAVYTAGDCALCHTSNTRTSTPAVTAAKAGGTALTDFFCLPPTTPTCTDNDGDTFAIEGGDCGPIDCDDNDTAINPKAEENCSDTIDNNCNGLIDDLDPAVVGCLVCTDKDGDDFALEGGDCGPIDCNDNDAAIYPDAVDIPDNNIDENCSGVDSVAPTTLDNDGDGYTQYDGDCNDSDATIHPGALDVPDNGVDENCDGVDSVDTATVDNDGDGFTPQTGDCNDTDGAIHPNAVENCTDAIDNNCNGLIDSQDPIATDCPASCTDNDGDTYAMNGGDCGPVDCNDSDTTIHPGNEEVCGDNLDNDCDGEINESCDSSCPDLDGDGYQDAACGGKDCNDYDAAVNPGAAEVCGNGIDENCNGASDDTCLTCPDGTLLVIKEMEYNRGDANIQIQGRATVGTSITIIDADTEKTLAAGIRVDKGKWEAEIKDVGRSLKNITVMTSNGCTVDQELKDYKGRHDDERKRNHQGLPDTTSLTTQLRQM